MEKPPQRPEGALIANAIGNLGLSRRQAAGAIGISEGRLRQIINGYLSAGRGHYIEVVAPADTLMRIAIVLKISRAQLAAAGRADAAEAMEQWTRYTQSDDEASANSRSAMAAAELQEWLSGANNEYDSPPSEALELWTDAQLLQEILDRLVRRQETISVDRFGQPSEKPGRSEIVFKSDREALQWFKENVPAEPFHPIQTQEDETDAAADAREKTDPDAPASGLSVVPAEDVEDVEDGFQQTAARSVTWINPKTGKREPYPKAADFPPEENSAGWQSQAGEDNQDDGGAS